MSGVWGAQRQASCQALGSVSGVQHQLVPVHVAGWSCSQGLGLGVLSFLAAGEPLGLGVELLHFVEAWRAACVEWSGAARRPSEDRDVHAPASSLLRLRLAGLCFVVSSHCH